MNKSGIYNLNMRSPWVRLAIFACLVLGFSIVSSHRAYALTDNSSNIPALVQLTALNECASTGNAIAQEQWLSAPGQPTVLSITAASGSQTQIQWNVASFYCDPNGYDPGTTNPQGASSTNFHMIGAVDSFGNNISSAATIPNTMVFYDGVNRWNQNQQLFTYNVPNLPSGTQDITITDTTQAINSYPAAAPNLQYACVGTPPPLVNSYNTGRAGNNDFQGTGSFNSPPSPPYPCPTQSHPLHISIVVQPAQLGATANADCTANQLDYNVTGTSLSGTVTGFVNGNPVGTRAIGPGAYTGSFPIAPNQSGTVAVTATLSDGTILTSGNQPFNCTGGSGTTVTGGGASGSASCVALTAGSFSPALPWDPGEKASATVHVNLTPPDSVNGPPGPMRIVTAESTSITAPPWMATSSSGTSATWSGTVPDAPGPFEVDWTFNWTVLTQTWHLSTIIEYDSSGNVIGVVQVWVADPPTTANYSITCGKAFNMNTSLPPTTPGATDQVIYERPYLRAYGGSISIGSGFGESCSTGTAGNRNLIGWNRDVPPFYGAGGEFAASVLDNIKHFVTAQASAGATANGSGLSFANVPPATTSGGYFGGKAFSVPCMYDYFSHMSPSLPDQAGSLGCFNAGGGGGKIANLAWASTITGDNYYNVPSASCNRDGLRINGASIAAGQQATIYVAGDLLIDGNITYSTTSGWTDLTQLPSFRAIVKGNIYITPNVTQLDGLYVAEGKGSGPGTPGAIFDCSNDSLSPEKDASQLTSSSDCRQNRLIVNGAFMANVFTPMRTIGTFEQNTDGSPKPTSDKDPNGAGQCYDAASTGTCPNAAEIFNYNPEMWLAPLPTTTSTNGPSTLTIDAITSLPPVL